MRSVAKIIAGNVDRRRRDLGLSWVEIQERSGVGRTTLTRVKNGENITVDKLDQIARTLRIDVSALLTQQDATEVREVSAGYPAVPAGYIRIKRLNIEASAGSGVVHDEPVEVLNHLDVLETWARNVLGVTDTSSLRVIGVRGDSMSPTINHNDLAFISTADREFTGDGIFALAWQGQILIKRLRTESNNRIGIISDNPAYPPQHVAADTANEFHIAGRVVGWWTLRRY